MHATNMGSHFCIHQCNLNNKNKDKAIQIPSWFYMQYVPESFTPMRYSIITSEVSSSRVPILYIMDCKFGALWITIITVYFNLLQAASKQGQQCYVKLLIFTVRLSFTKYICNHLAAYMYDYLTVPVAHDNRGNARWLDIGCLE